MIKRTLFFGNPAYLSTKHEQLVVSFPNEGKQDATLPIEDIGFLVLENPQITVTTGLLRKLVENKTAVITCDTRHMPTGFLQPLEGHTEQSVRQRTQITASKPLLKQLWQQTISAKIENQAGHLLSRKRDPKKLKRWATQVKSGDAGNHEAMAAAYYWQHLFDLPDWSRYRGGKPPNNLLNYGYAILRAVTARALTSTGLLPSFGIFHRNKYNAYCLADDIMEPYRPYVDMIVYDIVKTSQPIDEITTELKSLLLSIPAIDVQLDGSTRPLMNAMSRTTNSLWECFDGMRRKVLYPVF